LKNYRNIFLLVTIIFLLFVSTASAAPSYGRGIYLDTTCSGSSTSYVYGSHYATDNGYYPAVTSVSIYFEWYKNGVLVGTKQDEDSSAPINASTTTAYCYHDSSQKYKMVWSERWKLEDNTTWSPGATEYWN